MRFKVKYLTMKNKLIYIISAVAVIAALGFAASKISLPVAVSETTVTSGTTVSAESTKTVWQPLSTTTNLTEKITEALSTAIFSSTEKSTAAKETSVRTTASETTVAATQGRTLPFTIPVPTIQIPDFRPETTTAAPITKPINGEYDSSCFDSTVFIGNSRFISFKNYGLAKNVYAVVGLNVDTVFTKTVAGSTVTVIDELNGKDFEKVVLMFGDNECGWSSYDSFVVKYSKVIAAVRERLPEAEIYLHAVLPVSVNASATNEFGCNNTNINALNTRIEQLAAKEGIHFIAQPEVLKAEDGTLIPEAASDGIHLNKKYAKTWIISLADKIIYKTGG